METADVLIIGAGEAGVRATIELRRLGFAGSIALLDAEDEEPYERPPLSKGFMSGDEPATPKPIIARRELERLGVDFRPGLRCAAVARTARRVDLGDGRGFGYGTLVYALGASPRSLTIPGLAAGDALALRTVADAARIREALAPGRRVLVVGGRRASRARTRPARSSAM